MKCKDAPKTTFCTWYDCDNKDPEAKCPQTIELCGVKLELPDLPQIFWNAEIETWCYDLPQGGCVSLTNHTDPWCSLAVAQCGMAWAAKSCLALDACGGCPEWNAPDCTANEHGEQQFRLWLKVWRGLVEKDGVAA